MLMFAGTALTKNLAQKSRKRKSEGKHRRTRFPQSAVLTLSNWYKTSSNLDVHLPEPGHLHFVQVHFTTDKIRPGAAKIFFSGT